MYCTQPPLPTYLDNDGRMNAEYFAGMAETLGATYCHPFGNKGGVFYSFGLGGNFILSDNGGEINISGINRTIDLPSVPTSPPASSAPPGGTWAPRRRAIGSGP